MDSIASSYFIIAKHWLVATPTLSKTTIKVLCASAIKCYLTCGSNGFYHTYSHDDIWTPGQCIISSYIFLTPVGRTFLRHQREVCVIVFDIQKMVWKEKTNTQSNEWCEAKSIKERKKKNCAHTHNINANATKSNENTAHKLE